MGWPRGHPRSEIHVYPHSAPYTPAGRLVKYINLGGALGPHDWTATGRQLSDYENAFGTGQVHVWFDLDRFSTQDTDRQPA